MHRVHTRSCPRELARKEFGAASRQLVALGPGSHSAYAACARESGGKISASLSTAFSRTPGTERSGGEGDPGPSESLRREAAPNSLAEVSRGREFADRGEPRRTRRDAARAAVR